MFDKTINRLFVLFIIVSLLLMTVGCSSATVVSNWNDLPKDQPIRITTRTGALYTFEHWQIDSDKTVKETMVAYPRIVPSDNISSITTLDDSNTKLLKTSTLVLGCVGGVVLLIYVFNNSPTLPFGK